MENSSGPRTEPWGTPRVSGTLVEYSLIYQELIDTKCMKFGWILMKTVGGVAFGKSKNRKFCKVHRMTPHHTQAIGHDNYPTYVHCSTPSPKFLSISLDMVNCFQDILHFRLTPMLKFKCHKIFKTWTIAKKCNSLYSTTVANVLIKLRWHQVKTVGV